MNYLSRVAPMAGEAGLARLQQSCVAVIGLGGVGGFAAEALARSGVGALILVDGDAVEESNINRQLVADHGTLGQPKAEVMAARVRAISPDIAVEACPVYIKTGEEAPLLRADFVVDAIDDIPAKLMLIKYCHANHLPLISSMGAGNRLYPNRFEVMELQRTAGDPLARILRREARARGIEYPVMTVCSSEPPRASGRVPASLMSAAGGAGLLLAAYVIDRIVDEWKTE